MQALVELESSIEYATALQLVIRQMFYYVIPYFI